MSQLSRIAVFSGIVLCMSSVLLGAQPAGQAPPQTPKAQAVAPPPPCLAISQQSLRFGEQKVRTKSRPQAVIVSNRQKSDVKVTVSVGGDFALDAPAGTVTLAPDASMAAVVRFTPRREGAGPGVLTVASGCGDGLHSVQLLQSVPLWGVTPGWLGVLCSDAFAANVALAVVLGLLYWLAMVVVRWNRVAMPARFVLRAQIDTVDAELQALQAAAAAGTAPVPPTRAAELLAAARDLIDGPRAVSGNRFLNYIFWSRGHENTGWSYTYEAQKQMVPLLPEPTVRARLDATAAQLELADEPPCRELADIAKRALASQQPPLERLRALLAQALAASYDRDYNTYADLVSWQNKTSWLVGCGLLLIVVLTCAFPDHAIFFLVGATGGLLSRLSRSLHRKAAPTDYGASWTTLFLSPVAGALGAWVGILVAALAVKLNILNTGLGVSWADAYEPATLAVALAFGFSERLLDSVFDKLDEKAVAQTGKPKSGAFAIVDPGPLSGSAGQVGSVQLATTGATGSVTWTLVQTAPPTQSITITPGGLLSWGALAAGTSVTVSVQAADAAGHTTPVRQLTLNV